MKFTLAVLFLAGALCAAQETSSQVIPKPWEELLGSWREISGPDNATLLKVEPEGDNIKFSYGCKQDGSWCSDVIVTNYDGKPSKDSGNEYWEASFRKTGERTMQEDGYLDSKQVQTVKWQLSSDGHSLTRIYHTLNRPGSKDRTFAYDRSGGPVSKDGPFIGFWKYNWNKSDPSIITYGRKGDLFSFTTPNGVTSERNCDGKDHPNETLGSGFAYSCQFIGEHTYELTAKHNGKIVLVITRKVSEDGRTVVATTRNAEGKITTTSYLEKIK
jgi:hypothetical protein